MLEGVGRLLVYVSNQEALGSFLEAWGQAAALVDEAFGPDLPLLRVGGSSQQNRALRGSGIQSGPLHASLTSHVHDRRPTVIISIGQYGHLQELTNL